VSDFALAIPIVLANEGEGYVADDNGRGPSKWGVTLESYQAFDPKATAADIASMTPAAATPFYQQEFWQRYHIGAIVDQSLATKTLDLAVNNGGTTAVKLLQQAVGLPASQQDGVLGPITAGRANATSAATALAGLWLAARAHYLAIVAADPTKEPDLAGWLARNDSTGGKPDETQ